MPCFLHTYRVYILVLFVDFVMLYSFSAVARVLKAAVANGNHDDMIIPSIGFYYKPRGQFFGGEFLFMTSIPDIRTPDC